MSHRHRSSPSALQGFGALFQLIGLILEIPVNIRAAQCRMNRDHSRLALDEQRIREGKQKQEITAAEIALRNNKTVITDLDIEIKKLQLLKLQKELGLTAPEFNPDNYPE